MKEMKEEKVSLSRFDYPGVLFALHNKPGAWAPVTTAHPNAAYTLRKRYKLDVATRKSSDGTVTVWASWNPKTVSAEAKQVVQRCVTPSKSVASLTFKKLPPPNKKGRRPNSQYDEIAAKVRSRPGQWLFVGLVTRKQRVSAGVSLRERRCEVITRANGAGSYRVWARWPEKRKVGSLPVMQPGPDDRWEAPAIKKYNSDPVTNLDYLGVAEALTRRPGRWAKIWEGPSVQTSVVRRWFTTQSFSVSVRRKMDAEQLSPTTQIWVRWPENPEKAKVKALEKKLKSRSSEKVPALHWCNPPKRQPVKQTKYLPLINKLRLQPGMWAHIGTYPAEEINRLYLGLKRGGCEVAVRTGTSSKKRGIWARWPEPVKKEGKL